MINLRVQELLMYKYCITCSYIWTEESPYENFHVTYAQIQPYIYCSMEFRRTQKFLQCKYINYRVK